MSKPSIPFEQAVRYASISDVGMRRKNNQDSKNLLVSSDEDFWRKRGHLFVVADGMGAHAAGELASKMAADSIPHLFSKDLEKDPITALHHAVSAANLDIFQRGQAEPEFTGMGTTCSTLLLLPEGAVVAHVGDSRIYRLRAGQLDQLTFDHSLVWEMQAAGKLSDDGTDLHFPKNIITRSLGPGPKVQIDLEGPFPILQGDVYILCSDGLSGQISDHEIGAIVGCLSPAESAQILVDIANLRGGPDNITAIVVEVDHPPVAQTQADSGSSKPNSIWNWILFLFFLTIAAIAGFYSYQDESGLKNYLNYFTLGASICAIVTAIVTILKYYEKSDAAAVTSYQPKPLGHAPYRTYSCTPTRETTDNFSAIATELRKSAEHLGAEVDWEKYDKLTKNAFESVSNKSFPDAVYQHCKSISHIVAALKADRDTLRTSDSHIDLI